MIVYLSLIPEISVAIGYKTYNLKYDIQVDIPTGWKISPKNELMQISSSIPTSEFLLEAKGELLNKRNTPNIAIAVLKNKPLYTQEKLARLSLADFQAIREKAINDDINNNSKYAIATIRKESDNQRGIIDIDSIRILTERVDNVLALVDLHNISINGEYITSILYTIPTNFGGIYIEIEYSLNDENLMAPIIDKVLSSIKIGKTYLQVDEIETFLNTLRE